MEAKPPGVADEEVKATVTIHSDPRTSYLNVVFADEPWQCPSYISQSAAPALHSIASEIAGRLLTYSIDVRHNDRLSPVMSYVMLLLFRVQLQVSSCLMKDIDKSLILAVECWCPNQHAYKILVVCPSDISLGHD
ncbi:hypothetical protein TIFTF001_045131 [Ficus carica]|uniref:Uncharacterized protein n=1 Tax=Ficus carica TaxID=3494 RepID=A0AA87YNS0_FICCA|nr:hypothetical protein TIFTF001_045131 [Ficus carica]